VHAGLALADYDSASDSVAAAAVAFSLSLCSRPQPLFSALLTSGAPPPPPFTLALDALRVPLTTMPPPTTSPPSLPLILSPPPPVAAHPPPSPATPFASSSTTVVLPPPPGPAPPLLFVAHGTGEVAVALEMRFVPAGGPGGAGYRGIEVQKVVRLFDALTQQPHGPPLAAVPLGAVVSVTLQVCSSSSGGRGSSVVVVVVVVVVVGPLGSSA
jgi:hypothetical protein